MKRDLVLRKSDYYFKPNLNPIINLNHSFIVSHQILNSLIKKVYLEVAEVFSEVLGLKAFLKEGSNYFNYLLIHIHL